MSKPHATPTVLHSIAASLLVGLTGCLSPNGGEMTTNVNLSSETGGIDSSGGSEAGGSTRGDIMTTTEDPDTTEPVQSESSESSASASSSDETTGPPPIGCGDGVMQGEEECDDGENNANDAACTANCTMARCGDSFVRKGVETCDDGVNDGAYGGCAVNCKALAPYCGDGVVQSDYEECDEADPHNCIAANCTYATSCKEILAAAPDDPVVLDGAYWIKPPDKEKIKVLCDMDADGGGYTFLKVSLKESEAKVNASQAEGMCKAYGMHLLVPRSPAHAAAAVAMATSTLLVPVGGGTVKAQLDYMKILGIYPVTEGKSCVGEPLNSDLCDEWKATGEAFWVTGDVLPGLPGTNNCLKCSNAYYWKEDGKLDFYETPYLDGLGPETWRFMCDVGDKLP